MKMKAQMVRMNRGLSTIETIFYMLFAALVIFAAVTCKKGKEEHSYLRPGQQTTLELIESRIKEGKWESVAELSTFLVFSTARDCLR